MKRLNLQDLDQYDEEPRKRKIKSKKNKKSKEDAHIYRHKQSPDEKK